MAAYRTGAIASLKRNATPSFLMTPISELFVCRPGDDVARVRATMTAKKYDVAPWLKNQTADGFILRRDLDDVNCVDLASSVQTIDVLPQVEDDSPLRDLLRRAKEHPLLAVMEHASLVGLLHFADLNRAPLRVYFFAVMVQFEYALAKHFSGADCQELRVRLVSGDLVKAYDAARRRYKRDLGHDRNLALPFYFNTPLLVKLASREMLFFTPSESTPRNS